MSEAQKAIGKDGELGLTLFKEQFLLFSPVSVTHFSYLSDHKEQERNAWLWLQEKPNRYILTQGGNEMECFDANKAKKLGEAHRRDWILFDARVRLNPVSRQEASNDMSYISISHILNLLSC